VGYGREDTFSISLSDFQFVAVIGFDLILKCTLKPETRQRVFILISIGAQLGAQFIKMCAGCFKMCVSATELFNPSSKNMPGQHQNRCYSVFILMLDFAP
jgi:hypothetical protein